MKKIVCSMMALLLALYLCACGYNETGSDMDNSDKRLTIIYNNGYVAVYVDNETGVQYITVSNRGICVVVDENGNPLIYHPENEGGEQR